MRICILGSSAGGGLPQWNCRCSNCEAARVGSPDVQPRTQSSVAVSADGHRWFLLNVSPDVRQQILAFPALGPPPVTWPGGAGDAAPRGTAIAGCVLTDAELDHTAGLWLLREGSPFGIFCTPVVRRWLNRYVPVEPVLACFAKPSWTELPPETFLVLRLPDGTPSGLRVRAFEVDRHVPRFVVDAPDGAPGAVIGVQVQDLNTGGQLVYAPCTASLGEALRTAANGADCLLVDGTFWSDDEPIRFGIGGSMARGMGHVPVSGPGGSLDWLADLPVRHRVYVHINNTNPMLNRLGPEHRLVAARGVRVGADGDLFDV
jgi:pyrroloquinoline quinone biosynthesis protein B